MKNYLKIDFEIFQDSRLNTTDIILLYYFSSFEKCFTNNETLEKTFNVSKKTIERTIKKLKALDYIKVNQYKKGKKREILSRLYNPNTYKRNNVEIPEYMKNDIRPDSEDLTEEERKEAEELKRRLLG